MTSRSKKPTPDKAPSAQLTQSALGPCPISPTSAFTILIDTREPIETAWKFPEGIAVERLKLEEGDYTIKGFEGVVAVERKTLDDFVSSIMLDRYWNEINRSIDKGYRSFVVVVEASMMDIQNARYTSQIKPASVLGAISALAARYRVPVILADTRPMAAHYVYGYLKYCWDRRYKGVFWALPEAKINLSEKQETDKK